MSSQRTNLSNIVRSIPIDLEEMRRKNSRSILEDLFELLEEYAPAWYTQELHDRAVDALLNRAS